MPTPTRFYREVLSALQDAEIPFLIGGAYAYCRHVGIDRGTKDLDLLICKDDWPAVAQALRARGIVTRLVFPHWLGKALARQAQVDIIFSGGNGPTPVTRDWFPFAVPAKVLGHDVWLCAGRRAPLEQGVRHGARTLRRQRSAASVARARRSPGLETPRSTLCRTRVDAAELSAVVPVRVSGRGESRSGVGGACAGARGRRGYGAAESVPRHTAVTRPVSGRSRGVGLSRRATAAVWTDDRP